MIFEHAQPGARMAAEIAAQPEVLGDLVDNRADIAAVAAEIADRPPRFVLLVARGSSDHAALYAKYLIEILLRLPVSMSSPSVTTLYGTNLDLRDALVISVSQSGGSPDLLEVIESARRGGARTLAVSNTADSPLRDAADLAVDVRAGTEHAVAASKTYTATLLALYLLVDSVRGGAAEHVRDIAAQAERALAGAVEPVAAAVENYRRFDSVITSARGYSYATAAEAALKLAETSYLTARAYSGADLLHGPIAAIDEQTAVLAISSNGRGGDAMREVLRAARERGADVLAVGSASAGMPASARIPVPRSAEEVAPILEVLPVQRLALELARDRGNDPDHPRGLSKVTRTL